MKRILFILAAGAMMLTACNKDDNGIDPGAGGTTAGGGDIKFQIGIGSQVQTKVTTGADFKSAFQEGDAVGIFAVRRAGPGFDTLAASGNYIHNVKLTYNATAHTWAAEGDLWFPNNGDLLDFYAYYPYNDNGSSPSTLDPTAITFNVLADQSTALNYGNSDLLSANHPGVARGTAVNLTFAHKLSLVQVEVDPTYIDRNGNFTATLNNCKAGGAFNLGDGEFTTSGDAAGVKMLRVEKSTDPNYSTNYTYRALVPAQEVAEGTSLCLMAQNGQLYNIPTLSAALALTAGEAKRYTAKLPATAIQTVKITNGTFQMGEEGWAKPVHQVKLTNDFYMSKYQVTNAQYAAFLNASSIDDNGTWTGILEGVTDPKLISTHSWGVQRDTDKWIPAAGKDNFPVINVTWYGAKAYADWIGGSLPTEAQWEYACRAGTTTAFSFGASDTEMDYYGWFSGNSSGSTNAVGSRQSNDYGLYDMHGNVWEWCNDWYSAYTADAATDPTGSATGSSRVLRGGSWYRSARYCRSAFRNFDYPGSAYDDFGFRVVLVP